jgi:ABC-type Fe3+/spermidine/putrescine transport system ATPase subunit
MLELKHVSKTYEGKPLLKGISFIVKEGETVCLLGPSGSGKSTLLRIIAGLETPDAGQVSFDGVDLPIHRLTMRTLAWFPGLRACPYLTFSTMSRSVCASRWHS